MTEQPLVQLYTMRDIQHAIGQRAPMSRPLPFTQPHRSNTHPSLYRNDVKDKNSERDSRNNDTEQELSKISVAAKL